MENHSQEGKVEKKAPEIKQGQFCCFEVLSFPPIDLEFKNGDKTKYKNYHNVKFIFHSWYKRGSSKTFLIASNELTLKSNELLDTLSTWQGLKLDRALFDQLDAETLREMSYGLNALIEYKIQDGPTLIQKIQPAPPEKSIVPIPGLKVPPHLINRPIRKAIGTGFGSLVGKS